MDTVAAISTPHGIGGIAVIRLSGPDAFAIASRHLKSPGTAHPQLFRIGDKVLDALGDSNDWVRCFHAKCDIDPEKRYICQFPEDNAITVPDFADAANIKLTAGALAPVATETVTHTKISPALVATLSNALLYVLSYSSNAVTTNSITGTNSNLTTGRSNIC